MWSCRTLLVAVAVWATAISFTAESLELMLLNINDMHSRFDETDEHSNDCPPGEKCYGGFSRVAQVVKLQRARAKKLGVPSLFVVAGDTFQGTPIFSFFKWKPVAEFMNELKPEFATVGNHEFDGGRAGLLPYLKDTPEIKVVVTNMDLENEPELKQYIEKSRVLTLKGTSVGLVGYLTPDTRFLSKTDGIRLLDEIDSLTKEVLELRAKGINIIIVLGHSGYKKDQEIAAKVEGISTIIGAHSHTYLGLQQDIEIPMGEYPTFVKSPNGNMIPILQVYCNTKYIGVNTIRFDDAGYVTSIDGLPILLDDTIEKDQEMEVIVQKWKSQVVERTDEIIGITNDEFLNTCHTSECNLGNLIADAFVFYNRQNKTNDTQWTDASIGIIQAAGIRSSLRVGEISLGQILTVQPFTNNLVRLTILGSSVLAAFENSVSDYDATIGCNMFLQVSGVKVQYNLTRSPGNRVVSLFLLNGDKYELVNLKAYYTLIMTDYIANGGDNFISFTNKSRQIKYLGAEDYNATVDYIKLTSPIKAKIENRIIFTDNNDSVTRCDAPNQQTSLI